MGIVGLESGSLVLSLLTMHDSSSWLAFSFDLSSSIAFSNETIASISLNYQHLLECLIHQILHFDWFQRIEELELVTHEVSRLAMVGF